MQTVGLGYISTGLYVKKVDGKEHEMISHFRIEEAIDQRLAGV